MFLNKKILFTLLLFSNLINADAIFNFEVINESTGESFFGKGNDLTTIADQLNKEISINFANQSDLLNTKLDYRGLPVTLQISENSKKLTLNIPSLKIKKIFTGENRSSSLKKVEEWFKDGNEIKKIMKNLVKVSPVDPIAGNPSSLMSTSVENNFKNGFQKVVTQQTNSFNKSSVLATPSYTSLDLDGKNSDKYTLPFSYSFNIGDNSQEKVLIYLPISYVNTQGAKSYLGSIGVSYSIPILQQWTLTPNIEYSGVLSKELATFIQLMATSITSSYTIDLGNKYTISFGNMIGYSSTIKLLNTKYAINPNISNTSFRNALMYSIPTNSIYNNTSVDLFIINTKYIGTDLYLNSYNEIGFSFGLTNEGVSSILGQKSQNELKMGLTYLLASKIKGISINFGYSF